MDSPASPTCNRVFRGAVATLALTGLLIAGFFFVDQNRIAGLRAGVRSSDPQTRAKAIGYIASEREQRALGAVLEQLEKETDRELLEQAGYATMRLRDPRGLAPLHRRASDGPDDRVRGKLIVYTARLSVIGTLNQGDGVGRDPRGLLSDGRLVAWLETGLNSPGQWQRAGSAIGLLELGRLEAGQTLIEWLPTLEAEVRRFALAEFRKRVGEPMTQAAGAPLNWGGLEDAPPDDPRWAQLREFWQVHASARLLQDVLARQDREDPDWTLMRRLLHAREYVERWLL